MGARSKGHPPRKRGPKPEKPASGKWENMGKALQKPSSKGVWPQPPNKKGRGGR